MDRQRHAEMMRAEFESARRDRPNNGGTMVWMFNDCWPTSNWSIIDYYRSEKTFFFTQLNAPVPHCFLSLWKDPVELNFSLEMIR